MTDAAALAAFWRALDELDVRAFDPMTRRHAAQAWAERALNEHASIASFDRFALGLLAVGAPPELLEAAHHAALDEIVHSRVAFALASAYAGSPLGPGPLPIDGALAEVGSLSQLAKATAGEGCVAETLSAVEVRRASELTRVPAVRAALELIASDEERHAELAWATVRWAVAVGGEALQQDVSAALERGMALALSQRRDATCVTVDLAEHGFLDAAELARVRADAVASVLRPATAELALPESRADDGRDESDPAASGAC